MFEGMGGFENIEEAYRDFEGRVPHGKESFMVLTAHLIAERALIKFIKSRVTDENYETQYFGNDSPCRSGLGLILLAQGLSLRDEIEQTHTDKIWDSLKTLNSLRNKLAHELDPDSLNIQKRMRKFIEQVEPGMMETENDVNKAFRKSAGLLVILLEIDSEPLTFSDLD